MSFKEFNSLLEEYGLQGGMATLLGAYVLIVTDKLFIIPALDIVLLEKMLLFLFGMNFLAIFYMLNFFERKKKVKRREQITTA